MLARRTPIPVLRPGRGAGDQIVMFTKGEIMKISYFAIDNFRGISGGLENNRIIFEDTNTLFIFGQNNAGKSTFLQAYQFFYNDCTPNKDDYFKRNDNLIMQFEIEVLLEDIDIAKIQEAAPKQKESFKKYLINGNSLRIKSIFQKDKKITKKAITWEPAANDWADIGYASIGLHRVFQSCMPKPIFIKAMPNEEEVKSILNEILKSIAESKLKLSELAELKAAREKIAELQDKMYKPETINTYQESINSYFKKLFPETSLSIIDKKSRVMWTENKLGKEFDIEFNRISDSGEIDVNVPTSISSIGHGTIRAAIFTLLLMRDIAEEFVRSPGRKDYMVLFEEPELFLYPRILKELRDLIYQVSKDELPYQVLCASHSPQMIDISQPKSSIIRLSKENENTKVYQINDKFLKKAKDIKTDYELKQEMYEILRFNPHICESFYADEVILIEGPTEEIIIRAFLQEKNPAKDLFVLNCGSVTNIPFYQKIFSQFSIKYNVICDTDGTSIIDFDDRMNPTFNTNIQGSISKQFELDKTKDVPNAGLFRIHDTTFEPAHMSENISEELRFSESTSHGKPYNANIYWKTILQPNLEGKEILEVPIIKYISEIIDN